MELWDFALRCKWFIDLIDLNHLEHMQVLNNYRLNLTLADQL